MMIRMVGGWMFLLIPAHPGSPREMAAKTFVVVALSLSSGQSNKVNIALMPLRKISHWTSLFLDSVTPLPLHRLIPNSTMFVVSMLLLGDIDGVCLKTVYLYKNKKTWLAYLSIHLPSCTSGSTSSDRCAHVWIISTYLLTFSQAHRIRSLDDFCKLSYYKT